MKSIDVFLASVLLLFVSIIVLVVCTFMGREMVAKVCQFVGLASMAAIIVSHELMLRDPESGI